MSAKTRRYYLCAVVGTGTITDPYRAALPAGTSHAAVIPTGANGKPLSAWCLAHVAAADHAPVIAAAGVDPLPVLGLEERPVDFVSPPALAAFKARLLARGLTESQAATLLASPLRLLLRALGRRLDAHFDEVVFGLGGKA